MQFPIATRMAEIAPFHVMEVMKAADVLAEQGRDIIHLSVGEPDFTAPPAVLQASLHSHSRDALRYPQALGIMPLRQASPSIISKRME